ncbi:hypothetical protein [Aurantiacibacter spongiae]|uniref:Uncharacterized protein n=1 Tax=Aurantiacibacter spongiae TaxID=2488860 RepID=A0A3N5CUM2_9SPHN|nr:hypothetical protein [Aurantiacibacter spongiae]RPF72036.1 hypothetical protein EG799_10730 [Aurantiacibacter spongiae]
MAMAFETDNSRGKPRRKTKKTVIATAGGGLTGFLGAMAVTELAESGMLGDFGPSQEIAALVAMIYLVTALAVGIGLASPGFGARFLNVEDAEELREQRRMLGYSSAGMVALGVALILAALAAPVGPVPETVALVAVVLLVAFAWWAGARQRRHTDELMNSVSREATSIGFYLLFLIGGGWALLAHVGYAPAPAPLDWLTMFAGLLLLAAFIAGGKRGLLAMR